jgi:tRNA-dihydrouridine synthase B
MTGETASSPLYPENAVLLAPLADYTDYPFRRACRRFGCRHAFTPLIDAGCLTYSPQSAVPILHRGPDEPWLGVQLLGANPEFFEAAMRVVNRHEFDALDLNLGCPMPKVTKRGAGAALGLNLPLALECLGVILKRSRFPVTAKIRVTDMQDPEPTVKFALALQEAGIQALTIHGRVLKAIYAGPVAAPVIRAVREALRIPVIANGGVFDAATAAALRASTGCSRIMVARGAIGNPWLFRELAVEGNAESATPAPPSPAELCDVMAEHIHGMFDLYGEDHGMRCARKIVLAYLKGRGWRHERKAEASVLRGRAEFDEFVRILRTEPPCHVPPQAPRTLDVL